MSNTSQDDLKLVASLKRASKTHPFSYLYASGRPPIVQSKFTVPFCITLSCAGTVFHFRSLADLIMFTSELEGHG